VIVGKTNMTEFAYSGLGLNPHYGTPLNPCDRNEARIPGGSSSGAAVAVAHGMALASVGTDTGGSARIPAAFCGLTGYKPTASRIPKEGAFPLSPALDSVGAIARTVDCCARLDAVLSGERWAPPLPRSRADIVLGVVTDYLVDGLEPAVSQAYERALGKLSAAGIRLVSVPFPELHELAAINREGGFPAVESHRALGDLLASRGDEFDPRVAARIRRGKAWTPDDYARLLRDRERFIAGARKRFEGVDALLCPTVPMVAPRLRDLDSDEAFNRLNLLALRNPSVVNFLDGCAWSLPCQRPGELPVGLSLFQLAHADRALLPVALAVERELRKGEAPR
jgi:aspartyl-tRNA(Asn)/glutamyl-tRNA(Gln) amidotransferase subunit A